LSAATILRAHAPAAVADAFIATRITGDARQTYGQGLEHADVRAILARATPNR
jgi:putative acyl-CoA dehydrogenase